jgi:hypothetical protein
MSSHLSAMPVKGVSRIGLDSTAIGSFIDSFPVSPGVHNVPMFTAITCALDQGTYVVDAVTLADMANGACDLAIYPYTTVVTPAINTAMPSFSIVGSPDPNFEDSGQQMIHFLTSGYSLNMDRGRSQMLFTVVAPPGIPALLSVRVTATANIVDIVSVVIILTFTKINEMAMVNSNFPERSAPTPVYLGLPRTGLGQAYCVGEILAGTALVAGVNDLNYIGTWGGAVVTPPAGVYIIKIRCNFSLVGALGAAMFILNSGLMVADTVVALGNTFTNVGQVLAYSVAEGQPIPRWSNQVWFPLGQISNAQEQEAVFVTTGGSLNLVLKVVSSGVGTLSGAFTIEIVPA